MLIITAVLLVPLFSSLSECKCLQFVPELLRESVSKVEGPVGHKREEAAEVLERGKADRHEEMGLYGGDAVLKT